MENKLFNERVEKIMGSLNGIQKAGAPDFFYSRLLGKMQSQEADKSFFLFRPAYITAVLGIFLILNVVSIFEFKKTTKQESTVQTNTPATIETFAKAYDMGTGSVYE